MINKRPKGIKIDPRRLQIIHGKPDPKTIFSRQPKDKK